MTEGRDYVAETAALEKTVDEPTMPDIPPSESAFDEEEEVAGEVLDDSSESSAEDQDPNPVLSRAVSNLEPRRKEKSSRAFGHDSSDNDEMSWRAIRNESKENADPHAYASSMGGTKRKANDDDDNILHGNRKEKDENSLPNNNQPKVFSRARDIEPTRKLVQSLRGTSSRRALGPSMFCSCIFVHHELHN